MELEARQLRKAIELVRTVCNVSRLNCPRSEFVRNVNIEKVNINSCRFVSTKLKKTHVFSFQSNNASLRTPPDYGPNFIEPLLLY